jgi:hypothetical protein
MIGMPSLLAAAHLVPDVCCCRSGGPDQHGAGFQLQPAHRGGPAAHRRHLRRHDGVRHGRHLWAEPQQPPAGRAPRLHGRHAVRHRHRHGAVRVLLCRQQVLPDHCQHLASRCGVVGFGWSQGSSGVLAVRVLRAPCVWPAALLVRAAVWGAGRRRWL